MIITFKNEKEKEFYNNFELLTRKLGQRMAKDVSRRLQQALGAECLFDFCRLPQVRGHPLDGDRKGEWGADLVHPQRLIFEPDHNPLPRLDDGGLDTKAVTAIKILRVEDYHGKRKAK